MNWQPGEVPRGWTKGEPLFVIPAFNRHSMGMIRQANLRPPGEVKGSGIAALRFLGADRERVDKWIEWWDAP